MIHKKYELQDIFTKLQKNKISYILLRGHLDIPCNVSIDNDLDLICKLEQKEEINSFFKELSFKHYEDSKESNIYLYHAKPHDHYYCEKRDLHIDIVYNLSYQSPNKGEWVSVHQVIQDSVWQNIIKSDTLWVYQLSDTDLAVHLICHSVFDKKEFKDKHIAQLEKVIGNINKDKYYYLLELVFFKFTPYLIDLIEKQNYDVIIKNYLEFKEY